MSRPQTVDYNAAVQNPADCFRDPELARGQAAEGMIPGIPLSYAGNFATVYKIVSPEGQAWAVKCFTRQVDNLQQRYQQISAHLQRHRPRFTVDFQYQPEGVRVEGVWRPVVKMQWVEGLTLNEFLRERVGNAVLLERLCQLWLRLGNEMAEADMAHGDLQHGNVMLIPDGSVSSMHLRLVDYDGMWVPALAQTPPGEVGHANYQHPQRLREGGYSAYIDRFSHLAVYTALRCLIVGGKALWTAHDNDENVLFREADFKAPGKSKLFARLLGLPDAEVTALVGRLLLVSQSPLEQTPRVNDLLADGGMAPLTAEQIDQIRELVPAARLASPISPPSLPVRGWGAKTRLASPELDRPPAVVPADQPVLLAATAPAGQSGGLMEAQPLPAPPPLPDRVLIAAARPAPPPNMTAPEWLLRLGLAKDSLPARFWPIILGVMLGAPLMLLIVWLMWPPRKHSTAPPVVAAKAHLLPAEEVHLRAGHMREVALTVERPGNQGDLSIAVSGLPRGVSCPIERLAAGEGPVQVRLRLSAAATTVAFSGDVVVRLTQGDETLDEQSLTLTVAVFKRPRLTGNLKAIRLAARTTRLILARVESEGNSDPWTLSVDPLPKGVSQRPPRTAVPKGMAGVELTTDTDAPEQEGVIAVVSLLADGVPADSTNVSLSVKQTLSAVTVSLELPRDVRVQAGDRTSFLVRVRRNGYSGPIELQVEDLPAGVRATSATVAEGEDTARIELTADEMSRPRLELQLYRVIARVDGKPAGLREGTFHLTGKPPPVRPVEKPVENETTALRALQGTWTAVVGQSPSPRSKKTRGAASLLKVRIEGDQWTSRVPRKGMPQAGSKFTIQLDPKHDPKWIDLKTGEGTLVYHGVYTLEGDILKILCHPRERPTGFIPSSRGSVEMLLLRDKP